MYVKSLSVVDFRSFAKAGPVDLGRLNVFVGPNNAGKSSLLRALYVAQGGVGSLVSDVRLGASASRIDLRLRGIRGIRAWEEAGDCEEADLRILVTPNQDRTTASIHLALTTAETQRDVGPLPPREPDHVFVPYFSRRKVSAYQEHVREDFALQVSSDFGFLAAKLSRLTNSGLPAGERYREKCVEILGFPVTAVLSRNGQHPGAYMPDWTPLPIDQMGEGVSNVAGLLAELVVAKEKILLIEEPENDLHPRALKALLELIEEIAARNQVLVSTHSNIVVRHLAGAPDSRLFYVDSEPEALPPIASVRPVEATPEARLAVLRELGYSFSDFDLWDGWLILEESSAERIVRDYLIPWFAPRLARARTLAAGGNSAVEPTFDDFHRLVRFTHLEEAYRNAAWVRVDGDQEGTKIVARLRDRYRSWDPDRFATFSEAQFERYYPPAFADRVEAALRTPDKAARRRAKIELLDEVRAWLDEDPERGRAALAQSASSVIADLKEIEAQLFA